MFPVTGSLVGDDAREERRGRRRGQVPCCFLMQFSETKTFCIWTSISHSSITLADTAPQHALTGCRYAVTPPVLESFVVHPPPACPAGMGPKKTSSKKKGGAKKPARAKPQFPTGTNQAHLLCPLAFPRWGWVATHAARRPSTTSRMSSPCGSFQAVPSQARRTSW